MSLTLLAANNASTVLAAGISAAATSLTVASGTGSQFPTPVSGTSYFKLSLIDAATGTLLEVVHVTAVSGDTFTITRAQEGPTARIWSANDLVVNTFTSGSFSALAQLALSLQAANNLSDVSSPSTSLANLGGAPLASPALTGNPTVPTATAGTSTTQAANTAFVTNAITNAITAATGRLKNIVAITVSGTYTPSAGTTFIVVEGVGGGGGGGGAASASATASVGGGGGAGGYFMGTITSLASSYSVTIGGAGSSGTPSAVGGSGGTTIFGPFTAPGGSGGQSYTSAASAASGAAQGGATGTGSGGIVGISQSYGSPGWWTSYALGLSGRGGLSKFGDGGQETIISASSAQPGVTATGFGAGGSGAYSSGAGYSANGGAGKSGLVLVYEYQ